MPKALPGNWTPIAIVAAQNNSEPKFCRMRTSFGHQQLKELHNTDVSATSSQYALEL